MLGILLLSMGLAGFALPGLSQSPSPGIKYSVDSGDSPRPASSLRTHRNKTVRATSSQPSPAKPAGLDGAKEATAESSGGAAPQQGTPQGPRIWLQNPTRLAASFNGTANSTTKGSADLNATNLAQNNAIALVLAAGQAQSLSMVKGEFDRNGIGDLVVGYSTPMGPAIALYRGNLDAYAPQSDASFQAMGRGEFPAPFLPQAQVFGAPANPDFIATGNFTSSGFPDIVIAARGGNALYLFPGDGKGNFGAPQVLSIPGAVTTFAAGGFGDPAQGIKLFVGTSNPASGFAMSVFSVSDGALSTLGTFPLNGAASSIEFGDFGDGGPDAVFLSSGQVLILRSASMQIQTIPLPIYATGLALGSFLLDRVPGLQMALLASDGTIQFAVHNEFDPRPYSAEETKALQQSANLRSAPNPLIPNRVFPTNGWKVAESILLPVPVSQGHTPVLFRTRISSDMADDVMVINGSAGQMTVISHPDVKAGAATFAPGQASTRPYSGPAIAAIPARVNPDGRPGAIVLHQNDAAPYFMGPLPDPTFFVNRTDDPTPTSPIANACNNVSSVDVSSSCSLREAIIKANGIAGTDTIMLAAGTYTLGIPRNAADHSSSLTGTLEVQDSLNIIGAGQNTTIVQGGTSLGTSVDKVFSFNQDIDSYTNATVSISNFTIQNGHNRGTASGLDGFGGAFDFDTGGNGTPGTGNATLTLTNMTITNNAIFDGQGGGFTTFNSLNGSGFAIVANSIISNNNGTPNGSGCCGDGGGIVIDARSQIFITNTQISGNRANSNAGTNANGGGLFLVGQHTQPQSAIHASIVSGNSAAGTGGGMATSATLLIDQGTSITNNTAGNGGINGFGGGGIINNSVDGLTISKVTITGNSTTGNGGGIFTGNGSGGIPVTISFSRLAGNSSTLTPASSNLFNLSGSAPGNQVTATNNWWGTNLPGGTILSNTTLCPASAPANDVCFDPFIVLTNTASPNKIRINQSTTLTGDMSLDNHGNGAALAGNLDVLNGLPITFNNVILGTIPQAQPEALNVGAQATATFNAGGTGGQGSADATVDQQTVTANIAVLQAPSITKSFNPITVAVNAPSTITFSITNGNTVTINASFTDTLPTNLVVATTPSVVNGCNVGGGTVTATAGTGTISFNNAALAVGTCSITVNVQGTADGVFSNSVTIDSTDAGNGNTASANLTVINALTITKVFGASTIPLNGTTSLSFTLTSTNANLTLNGVAFTDSLPAGLVVATPSNLNNTCSGTATAIAGSGSVSLTGSSLAPGATCTVSVNVTGTTGGVKNNSVQVSSTNGGTGNTSNASITVASPPVIIKAFGAASIPLNGSTSLSFTIQNNNTTQTLSGIGFTDTLPAGLLISTPNGLTGSCGGGTITATQGTNAINLTGAPLAQSSSCTFSVNVMGTSAGQKNNTTSAVTSTEGGTGGTASASITVIGPPAIAKAFGAANVPLNGTTSLTLTITNPAANTVAEAGVAFADALPAGIVVATPNGLANTCGGAPVAVAGSGSISLTAGTVATSANCTLTVNVTGTAAGHFVNTTGTVTSTNGGTGNTATANLNVASPPAITKAFGAASVPLNGSASLTFNITNPVLNTIPLTGIAFTDNLPAGLIVATPSGLASTCGGISTAVAGTSSVSLSGATLATNTSCTLSVNVTGTLAGVKNNSVQATSTEGGPGNTSNASITVAGPPVIIKAFGAASIPLNGSTSLSFTIQNNNATSALSSISFTDTLPAGLVISTPSGLSGTCGGGTITATQGTSVINLLGGTLASSSSCNFAVNVKGTAAGTQNNTTGNVTSTEGGTGGTASASIAVVAPPSIAKAFGAANVPLNGTTSLTLTITNPAANTVAETGVAFADALPAGIVVATPNGLANTCGGVVTAVAGSGNVSLAGGTVATSSNCTLTVNVTGTVTGNYTNTTGAVTSTNGGTGAASNTANLTVAAPPTIVKAFGAPSIPLTGVTSLTFNIQNPNTVITLTGTSFTDNLPAGLVVATPNNLNNTCGGAATAAAGSSSVSLAGGTLAPTVSCTVSINVTGTLAGVKNNSVQVTSTDGGPGNTSNASITVAAPPVIIKAFGAANIPLNVSTSLSFTIQNNNATGTLTGIGFSDTLPAGLLVSTPNGLVGTCGSGTITATQGTNVINLLGATLASSSSCTFSVNVTGTAAGAKNNTTGNVTSIEGGTGGTASATVSVVAPPSIAKAFGSPSIPLNGSTSLTLTITNPAANTVAEAGVAFADALPAGIVVATPNGLANTCGGVAVAVAGSGNISLTAGTIAASSNCTLTVNVTGTALGQLVNTTGAVSSTNGGTGNTGTANVDVAKPPTITKSFLPISIALNTNTALSFTITNPATNNISLTGVAFTDSLPAGLVVATPNGLSGSCGGTITAVSGSSTVSLAAGTLTQNTSCTFSVNATGTAAGIKSNSVTVTATESGPGNTSNATVTVVAPPVITKAFAAASIPLNGLTSLTFTINNPSATANLTGIGFSDTLPAGLVVSTPNGLTGTCGAGTITATQGTNVISLSTASLLASASCSFAVNVTGTSVGAKNNTTGNIASVEGGAGGTASASIAVLAPPSIAKAFSPNSIALNTNSTLTFTITNPPANTVAETGVGFTDTFPAGIVVATPNGLANTCGGAVTATAGSSSVTLAGGTIAASSSCTIAVNTTGTLRGNLTNTSGAVSSTNGGTGNTASASITIVTPDLTITKLHSGNFLLGEIGATYSLTVNNIGLDPTAGIVTAMDVLPVGLTATAIGGTGWNCTLATLTCTRSDALPAGSSYPAITITVNVAANAANPLTNNASVSGGGEANLTNDTATDATTIATFIFTAPVSTMTIRAGQIATFNLTVTPVGGAVTIPVSFTDVTTAPKTTLAVNPMQVTPGASPASPVLTAQTTPGLGFVAQQTLPRGAPLAAILFPMGLVVLARIGAGRYGKNKKVAGWIALVLVVSCFGMGLMGCAGMQQNFQNLGTTPGTYVIMVTASAGGTQQTLNLTLIVQP